MCRNVNDYRVLPVDTGCVWVWRSIQAPGTASKVTIPPSTDSS